MIFNIKLKDNEHNYLVDRIKQSFKKISLCNRF